MATVIAIAYYYYFRFYSVRILRLILSTYKICLVWLCQEDQFFWANWAVDIFLVDKTLNDVGILRNVIRLGKCGGTPGLLTTLAWCFSELSWKRGR